MKQEPRRNQRQLWLSALVVVCSACTLLERTEVNLLAQSARKPSNVALLVSVTHAGKAPTDLDERDIEVFEDAKSLNAQDIGLSLLPKSIAVEHQALILVDMSGALHEVERVQFAKQLDFLVKQVRQTHAVAVYAFDGSAQLTEFGTFPRHSLAEPKPGDFEPLLEYRAKDTSTALHSAVISGIAQLRASLDKRKKPLGAGSLLVVARGPDLAGRSNADEVYEALSESPATKVLITVGSWDERVGLDGFEPAKVIATPSMLAIGGAFKKTLAYLREVYDQQYLISYCSPARSGSRELTLEVTVRDEKGQQYVGALTTTFDATGFGAGCDPLAPPLLNVVPNGRYQPRRAAHSLALQPRLPAPP